MWTAATLVVPNRAAAVVRWVHALTSHLSRHRSSRPLALSPAAGIAAGSHAQPQLGGNPQMRLVDATTRR